MTSGSPSSHVTAGFLNTDWNPRDLPPGASTRNVAAHRRRRRHLRIALPARRPRPDTVVCVMHPREFMACHYLIPDIVGAGCAAWSQGARSVGNDLRLEHETALLDVAAGLAHLRGQGFKRIVLLGNSGGAGSMPSTRTSRLPAAERIARTPGGKRSGLNELDMPTVDGMVLIGPHPGQGALLLNCIDPSVADENDALSVTPELDPLAPANGYQPGGRAATRRLSSTLPRGAAPARGATGRAGAADDRRAHAGARRAQGADGTLARTASPGRAHARDGGLAQRRRPALPGPEPDPSDRHPGSLWGKDPYASNYGAVGFARFCTPESWLSTWSGLSSNASLARTARGIVQPTLIIEYTGDQACFPSDVRAIHDAIPAADKTHLRIRGDHHGRALAEGEEPGRYAAGRELAAWLRARFL